jgi:serine/threonine protein kinase
MYVMSHLKSAGRDVTAALRDAQTLAKLSRPGLTPVLSAGMAGEELYQILESPMGPPLAERLRGRPLPTRTAAELVAGLASALAAAHEKGIAHLDLHPGNIECGNDDQCRITRFALAPVPVEVARSGEVSLRLSYLAPEQIQGKAAPELSADVYALGAILCELLTGRPPWQSGDPEVLKQRILKGRTFDLKELDPSLPASLRRIVNKCVERVPELRYESAGELAADLKRFLSGELVQARGPGLWRRILRSIGEHPIRTLVVPAIMLGLFRWAVNGWSSFEDMAKLYSETLREKSFVEADLERTEVNLRESFEVLEKLTKSLGRPEFDQDPQVTALRKQAYPELLDFHATLQRRNGDMSGDDLFVGISKFQTGLLQRLTGELPQAEESLHNSMRLMQFKRRVPTKRGNLKDDDPVVMTILGEGNLEEGLLLIDSNRSDEAVGCFDAALYNYDQIVKQGAGTRTIEFRMARILANRARAYRLIKDHAKSLADLEEASRLLKGVTVDDVPSTDLALLECEIRRELGLTHLALEKPDEATRELEQALELAKGVMKTPRNALELRPRTADLHADLAQVMHSRQQPAEAEQQLKNSLELWKMLCEEHPEIRQFHLKQAEVLTALGQTADAEAAKSRAEKLVPQNPLKMAIPKEFIPKQLP